MSMLDGNTVILSRSMGEPYKLNQSQVDEFNTQLTQQLAASTPEVLVANVLDDLIDDKQFDYEEAKESLIEAASDIQEVVEVAEMVTYGDEETRIAAQDYAETNELTSIQQDDVDTYNASIDNMLEASLTKNMIEAYSQDLVLVDNIAQEVINTQSTQAFFDTVTITIDELNPTQLNVAWEGHSMGVESDMYYYYTPNANLEVQLRNGS